MNKKNHIVDKNLILSRKNKTLKTNFLIKYKYTCVLRTAKLLKVKF